MQGNEFSNQRVERGFDDEVLLGKGMPEREGLGLEEHPGAGVVFGSELVAAFDAGIAIVADVCSFQFKERKKIIIFFMIAASCIALHYVLLERYVAAGIVSI